MVDLFDIEMRSLVSRLIGNRLTASRVDFKASSQEVSGGEVIRQFRPPPVEAPFAAPAKSELRVSVNSNLTQTCGNVERYASTPVRCRRSEGDERQHPFCPLAYGTDAETKASKCYSIFVRRGGSMAKAGLTKPTHFVCARRITISLDHTGFKDSPATGSPIIGQLDETLLERMNTVRARIHAEYDIAVERRCERDEEQRRWQRE